MNNLEQKFDPKKLKYDFGNVQYEIDCCRNKSALFDFSFMTIISVRGKQSGLILEKFASRPIQNINNGQIRYALHCCNSGYALSDVTIWRIEENNYLLFTGRFQDYTELQNLAALYGFVETTIELQKLSTLSVQGPQSLKFLKNICDVRTISKLRYYEFTKILIIQTTYLLAMNCRN